MKAQRMVLPLVFCVGALAAPALADARDQAAARGRQTRFRGMDLDGDGVITRAEWRGSPQAFRQQDRNHDGVLSGDEVSNQALATLEGEFRRADRNGDGLLSRREWWGDGATFDRVDRDRDGTLSLAEFLGEDLDPAAERRPFNSVDRNGNGVITMNEWYGQRDEFLALDEDGDGVLTRREYRLTDDVDPSTQSTAYRLGRERGLTDGRQAGREDRTINGGKWDLDGQRELESADAGYEARMGSRGDYQAGYRAGFRLGYREGFGPR